jgi:hypothetical protein
MLAGCISTDHKVVVGDTVTVHSNLELPVISKHGSGSKLGSSIKHEEEVGTYAVPPAYLES